MSFIVSVIIPFWWKTIIMPLAFAVQWLFLQIYDKNVVNIQQDVGVIGQFQTLVSVLQEILKILNGSITDTGWPHCLHLNSTQHWKPCPPPMVMVQSAHGIMKATPQAILRKKLVKYGWNHQHRALDCWPERHFDYAFFIDTGRHVMPCILDQYKNTSNNITECIK